MMLRFEIDSDKLGEIIESTLSNPRERAVSYAELASHCVEEIMTETIDRSSLIAIDHTELPGLLTEELRGLGLAKMTTSEEMLREWAKKLAQAIVQEARRPKDRVH